MKYLVTTLFCLSIYSFCFAQGDSTQSSIMSAFLVAEQEIEQINDDLIEEISSSEKIIDSLNSIIADKKVRTENKLAALDKKVKELEKQNEIRKQNEEKKHNRRFEAGKLAISTMKSGVKILNFTYTMLDLDQTIEQTTNLWADSTFRNFWDKLEDWGTVTGMAIAVGGGALTEEDTKITSMISGLSIAGISKLAGVLGGINEKKFRQKMERIDLSVRAYDDLKIRNNQLTLYIKNNLDFKDRIENLERSYITAKKEDQGLQMAKLVDMLDEYRNILSQIPNYLDAITSVAEGYINNKDLYKETPMDEIFAKVLKKVKNVREQYNSEIKPLFEVSPEIKKIILGID